MAQIVASRRRSGIDADSGAALLANGGSHKAIGTHVGYIGGDLAAAESDKRDEFPDLTTPRRLSPDFGWGLWAQRRHRQS